MTLPCCQYGLVGVWWGLKYSDSAHIRATLVPKQYPRGIIALAIGGTQSFISPRMFTGFFYWSINMKLLTATQIFLELGKTNRLTKESTLPLHVAYVKADKAQQTQMRTDCMRAFIVGALACSDKVADSILSQSRTERKREHQLAYLSGSTKFSEHVIRKEATATEPKKSKRISAHIRAVATKFLSEFDGDVNAAIAVLKAMK